MRFTWSSCVLSLLPHYGAAVSIRPSQSFPVHSEDIAGRGPASLLTQAHLHVPCQGCDADGADALLPFFFQALPQEYNACTSVPFTINGASHVLNKTENEDAGKLTFDLNVEGRLATLTAELFCALPSEQTVLLPQAEWHYQPTVQVTLDRVDEHRLTAWSGFSAAISQHPVLALQSLTVGTDAASVTYSTPPAWDVSLSTAQWILAETRKARVKHTISNHVEAAAGPVQIHFNELSQPEVASCRGIHCSLIAFGHRVCDASTHFRQTSQDRAKKLQDKIQTIMADLKASTIWHVEQVTSVNHNAVDSVSQGTTGTSTLPRSNPLLRALEILAGALGLTALLSFLRRRFGSLRRRVDRLADREERRTARAYRRAARKQAFRQRWQTLKTVFCWREHQGDLEEKRALILAAEEEGMGFDEKTMTHEEIAELRVAREAVIALVRPLEPSSAIFVETDVRSATGTLPSYKSDILPAYTSAQGSDSGRYKSSGSPSVARSRSSTVLTPDSSIPDLSSRCSTESLRTRSSNM